MDTIPHKQTKLLILHEQPPPPKKKKQYEIDSIAGVNQSTVSQILKLCRSFTNFKEIQTTGTFLLKRKEKCGRKKKTY